MLAEAQRLALERMYAELNGEVIDLRGEPTDEYVTLAVHDRGPGIAPEQRAGLFERFYRVRPGSEEPGVGLGLAIAKGHRGSAWW